MNKLTKRQRTNKHFTLTSVIKAPYPRGFTIIELLIVIVVIGILVAITAVSYNGITNQVKATETKVDTANLHKSMDMYMTQRKDTGNLTEAEMEKIVGNLRKKVYISGVDDLNLHNSSSTDIKRGEYFVELGNYHYVNGTTEYFSTIYYWDTEFGQWMILQRFMNSQGENSKSTYAYNGAGYYTDGCKTEYFGQCQINYSEQNKLGAYKLTNRETSMS